MNDSSYGHMVFLDEEKRKEWEALPESSRKGVYDILHRCARDAETRITMDILCNTIRDLHERVKKLEDNNHE